MPSSAKPVYDEKARMQLTAQIQAENGSYWAQVIELPGCFASGDTLDELFESLGESVSAYLADDEDAPAPGSLHVSTATLTDAIPA